MNLPVAELITGQAALGACIDQCRRSAAIALDTEFIRTDTFYPLLGLVQLSDGQQVWLVDPLAVDDLADLKALLVDPSVVKVFHSCSEDLEVLRQHLGIIPEPLFDTQVAAGFLGYGYSRGYSALVEAVLDVQLDKHETRSDWLQRPLSAAQMQYAAEDVHYLMQVYRRLVTALEAKGRASWVAEDMAELAAQARAPDTPDDYYLRVKGAQKLGVADLAMLRELTRWREQEARDRDRPRGRVVPDRALLDLLRLKPRTVNGLHGVDGFHTGIIRRYGERIMAILASQPDSAGLQTLEQPLEKPGRTLLAGCREVLDGLAGQLDMAAEILARKKDLEPLVRSALAGQPRLPARLAGGWRLEVVGRPLLDYVTDAVRSDD